MQRLYQMSASSSWLGNRFYDPLLPYMSILKVYYPVYTTTCENKSSNVRCLNHYCTVAIHKAGELRARDLVRDDSLSRLRFCALLPLLTLAPSLHPIYASDQRSALIRSTKCNV
jgi:hypothetical protein